MPLHIDIQMRQRGYRKVEGVAILNDVAVTETNQQILSPTLSTQASVDAFNAESDDDWVLYRKIDGVQKP
jgi:hypothetical protein